MFTSDGMNDGQIPLRANDHENKNGCGVTQTVHKLIHFTQKLSENPAATRKEMFKERDHVFSKRIILPRDEINGQILEDAKYSDAEVGNSQIG